MKHQVMNPYLPLYEYVPDGEPHVFENRLFVYGSHDLAGSTQFCEGDYVVWSAPLDDFGNWKYEGISYPITATGENIQEIGNLAAPDCAKGPDGRYYLYYNCGARNGCEVAVSDKPQGPFTYLCNVAYPDGREPNTKMFDPGVLVDDDGRIFLYVGFCPTPGSPWINVAGKYSLGFELEPDMHTIKYGPVEVLPGCLAAKDTEYEGHGFYEASSPRKINGKYYMVYSSELTHDLCYAVSEQPLCGYHYGGVLVSNADIGYNENTVPKTPYGNTHGGLVQIGGQWYIFYHRHTHGIECCRQGCAEPITLDENGVFHQVEMTCCGLNGGPLKGIGTYNAAYACNLMGPAIGNHRLTVRACVRDIMPHVLEIPSEDGCEENAIHCIANMTDGTIAGFKYFAFSDATHIELTMRAETSGKIEVFLDEACENKASTIIFEACKLWTQFIAPFETPKGVYPLFFRLTSAGSVDWKEFTLR